MFRIDFFFLEFAFCAGFWALANVDNSKMITNSVQWSFLIGTLYENAMAGCFALSRKPTAGQPIAAI